MGTGEVGKFEEMEEKRDGWEMAVDKERERLKLELEERRLLVKAGRKVVEGENGKLDGIVVLESQYVLTESFSGVFCLI